MSDTRLLDADAMRRGAWLAAGLLGLPAFLIGLLYLVGFPLAAITAGVGFLVGRSWVLQRMAILLVSPLAVSIACAFLATYKVGNLVRVRVVDPRS